MGARLGSLSTKQKYAAALACVVAASGVRWGLSPLVGASYPYLLQYFTILVVARYLGFGPAMLGLVAGTAPLLFGIEFIAPPLNVTGWPFWVRLAVIYGCGALLIWTLDRQRRIAGKAAVTERIASERLEQLSIEIEQREREQSLSAQLRAIVESSDDAIISKGLDSVIRSWNYGAEQIYGYSAAETIGRTIDFLVPPDRLHEESDMTERIRHGGRVRHFETVRIRKDGAPIHISMTISPIRDKRGQIVGISHISREITARKELEEQLRQTQKLESLGVLAGGLAHDFNNLLTGIMGNSSLAIEELPAGHPARDHISVVLTASERAALLIRQMLAYAGKASFHVATLNLSTQVGEIVSLIRASMASHVKLDLQLAEDLPLVEADRAQVQQVIMNLAINGAEAIDGQGGTLTIATFARQTESEQQVILQVSDTGCGMDDVTRARIFDPFYTTKFTGRGLGLSAVIGIIRAHHGFISVESAAGHGSTFTVILPAAAEAETAPVAESRGYGHMLVIGEDELTRDMARFNLERSGYTVETASDVGAALEAFASRANTFDGVLLDLAAPLTGGEEILNRLRAVRPETRVLLSSALSDSEAQTRFGHCGCAGFLQRPYTAAVLARKVKHALYRGPSRPG